MMFVAAFSAASATAAAVNFAEVMAALLLV